MIQAFKRTGLKPTERLVAYMLADHHNDDTGRCDPSVPLLMEETGLDARTISRALQRMEESGHITVNRPNGRRNTYTLHPLSAQSDQTNPRQSAGAPPAQSRPRQSAAPGRESGEPPAESRGNPRQKVGAPPAESRGNHKEPEENRNLNQKDISTTLFPESDPTPESVGVCESLPQPVHEAWGEWQVYRQRKAKAKGKEKQEWTFQNARINASMVKNYVKSHGADAVCGQILSAISSGWKGMNLDKMEIPRNNGNQNNSKPTPQSFKMMEEEARKKARFGPEALPVVPFRLTPEEEAEALREINPSTP